MAVHIEPQNKKKMKLEEIRVINKAANTIAFTLAKMLNNYGDIIEETPAKGWISKYNLLSLIEYDPIKKMFRTAKNFNSKVFDMIERQREFNDIMDEIEYKPQNDIARQALANMRKK